MAELGFPERVESAVATLLRLPAAGPEPPPGSSQVRVFRAAPRYLQYNLVRWGISQMFAVFGLGVGYTIVATIIASAGPVGYIIGFFEAIGVAIFLGQLPISLGVVWLDFHRRWYLVTDRSLRIREGVWTMHERTMSFANVQNLEIRQGPIWGLLGIASLEAKSAGGGQARGPQGHGHARGPSQDLHVAYFRGVDNAEEIRDLILARLRGMRDSGLGDLDEERDHHAMSPVAAPRPNGEQASCSPTSQAGSTAALAAAGELLNEARALRVLLS